MDPEKERARVIINTAMSLDGKIATPDRAKTVLSNDLDLERMDEIRGSVDAILVGSGTIRTDNPRLTVKNSGNIQQRLERGVTSQPFKIVISPDCDIPIESVFVQVGSPENKIVFTTQNASEESIKKLLPFCRVIVHKSDRVDIRTLTEELLELGIKDLLVEGGGGINFSFIESGVVDEIRVAVANCIIGGKDSPTLADGTGFLGGKIKKFKLNKVEQLDQVVILTYVPPKL